MVAGGNPGAMSTVTVWKFDTPHVADDALAKVAEEFSGTRAELIKTNLSEEQDARLREAFGEGE